MHGDAHGVVGELLAADVVHGQQHAHALGLGLFEHLLGQVELVVLAQGVADAAAQGLLEGVGHAAADDQGVDLVQQVVDDADLVGDLGAAQDRDKGTGGILQRLAHDVELLADQEAGDRGQVVGNALGGGVRAVRGAKGVVDIDLRKGGQLLGELRIVLFLFLVEADVLQQNDVARLHRVDALLGVLADDVLGQDDLLIELLAQALRNGGQGILHVEFALGTAQVRAEDDGRIVVQEVLDGGQRRHDAGVVGDLRAVQGDVEVAAHEYALAGYIDIFDGLLVHNNTHSLSA